MVTFLFVLLGLFAIGFVGAYSAASFYKKKYREEVKHSLFMAKKWQALVLTAIDKQIDDYFKGTLVTNHIIRVSNHASLEITIGDEDTQIPIDMAKVQMGEPNEAFEEAYHRFVEHAHS